jgi:regulatory protein SWI5
MANMPARRTHRRGQTVDYGSFGPQLAVDRRCGTNKVTQLRDFFNEKAAFSRQAMASQQFTSSSQHDQRFIPSGLSLQPEQYQTAYMWNPEELQEMYTTGSSATFPTSIAPALARSASDNPSSNPALKGSMHQLQEERQRLSQAREQKRWGSFPQQYQAMMHKDHTNVYGRTMQQLSVQPEIDCPKINPYLSCMV